MSTLVLDTITGKSTATTITIGSTPVVSASATSMTIRGEGSAQTSIQQGLAKAWGLSIQGADPVDSFNVDSCTDVGTGIYEFNYTSNMVSVNISASGMATAFTKGMGTSRGANSTSLIRVQVRNQLDSLTDNDCQMSINGDLA